MKKKIMILPLKQFMYHLSLVILFLGSFTSIQAQLVLNTTIINDTEEQVTVEFEVQNFVDILAIQFSMQWESSIWEYERVEFTGGINSLSMNNIGTTLTDSGQIMFSWLQENISGLTLSDDTSIFRLVFNKLSTANTSIIFTNYPTAIEVISSNFTDIGIVSFTNEIIEQKTLRGRVFNDNNENCIFNDGETPLGNFQIELSSATTTRTFDTFSDGSFVTGVAPNINYTIRVTPPLELWTFCEDTYTFMVDNTSESMPPLIQFAATPTRPCPLLEVDISTPFLRRCFPNTYSLRYANIGTLEAEDAFVIVKLDPTFDFQSSTVNATDLGGNEFRFALGDLPAGSSGMLHFEVIVNCDESALGQTHCVEANIFPVVDCFKNSPSWSEADLELEIKCEDDNTVQFKITNTGIGDMAQAQEFSVFEDMIMLHQAGGTFDLRSNEEYIFELPANGATYRLETNQVPNHPFQNLLGVALEGCGENEVGEFSLGHVTTFPLAARSHHYDIDCQENIGAYDPNDKQGFPKGFGEDRLLKQNTDLEYLIRFQNTGTDTAFNIVVLDTLSELLDPASVKPLSASHPYRYEQLDKQILKFTFPNIMLPDSNINEAASHGFIRFQIAQQADLEDDLLIENKAAIYFDFNDPIITNIAYHKIGEPVFETTTTAPFVTVTEQVSVLPNPFSRFATVELEEVAPPNTFFYLYDMLGREVQRLPFLGKQLSISRADLEGGMYIFSLRVEEYTIYTNKLIIQD